MTVQMLSVQNDDSAPGNPHNYCTVGVQSPDHTDGLEYTFAGALAPGAAVVGPGRAIGQPRERILLHAGFDAAPLAVQPVEFLGEGHFQARAHERAAVDALGRFAAPGASREAMAIS